MAICDIKRSAELTSPPSFKWPRLLLPLLGGPEEGVNLAFIGIKNRHTPGQGSRPCFHSASDLHCALRVSVLLGETLLSQLQPSLITLLLLGGGENLSKSKPLSDPSLILLTER